MPVTGNNHSQITSDSKVEEVNSLDPEISELLGKRLDSDNPLGPAINTNIAVRWKEILSKGLPRDEQKEIIKKYSTPENCKELNAPRLNPEIKASLPEGAISRDTRMISKQTKLSICLSALGQALNSLVILKKDEPLVPEAKKSCVALVSDACRLLLEVQREESQTRRALILTNLNPTLKDALNEVKFGELLFDKELDGIIKTSKCLEKTSNDLKKPGKTLNEEFSKNAKRPLYPPAKKQQRSSGPTNFRPREKKTPQKPRTRGYTRRESSHRGRK